MDFRIKWTLWRYSNNIYSFLFFQAPFYPAEAEKKGCMPSEYGLVFGIFELTVFLVSPIIGANLNRMGMKMTLNVGIGTVGVTSIFFG